VCFPPDSARQIQRVLRLSSGERVTVLDNLGNEYGVVLEQVSTKVVTGKIISRAATTAEPVLRLTMLLSLTQREKFEWMLQKCTELGAVGFIPVITSRCLVQTKEDNVRKHQRWEAILREAAEQSQRGIIPRLFPVHTIEQVCAMINQPSGSSPREAFILSEHEQQNSLWTSLNQFKLSAVKEIYLLIGPEGGFTPQEIQDSVKAGFKPISLGSRILRMETAAMTIAALFLYEAGEMEGKPQRRW